MPNELADAIATAMRNQTTPQVWGVGTVSAVSAPTVDVDYLGDTFTMHYLKSYASPTVGDIVLILIGGDQLTVLGEISG